MNRPLVIARDVSPTIARCELTHVDRAPIDLGRAQAQHAQLLELLEKLGYEIDCLPADSEHPDSVFVEDTAVVFDDVAVLTRPGAESRRGEVAGIAAALKPFRPLARIEAPGTLDGGDVLVTERDVFVGLSTRTNEEGVRQLAQLVEPAGLKVHAVRTQGCLHLKSTACRVGERTLLVQPKWVDPACFGEYELVEVDEEEAFAANAIWTGSAIVHPAEFPRTRARLEAVGIDVRSVPADELAKAEGAVTCCALLVSR